MIQPVKIGARLVGPGQPCYIIGDIGINHNGSVDFARRLVEIAADAGLHAVKFQKRTIDVVYTTEELARPRENPFGTTNGDLKRGLEFGLDQYRRLDADCKRIGLDWFASCWDEGSVDFIEQFNPPAYKLASASLTDDHLLRHHRQFGRPIILSTGMSSIEEIDHAVEVLGTNDLIILHCTSTYPCPASELNLSAISRLAERYQVPVGYSGHEVGIVTTAAAVALGACVVERHITLDRAMWGSDHAASVEPEGIRRLVKYIKAVEESRGDGEKKVFDSEVPVRQKLRRIG
jgi:N-acetylneuraminate synthase